MPTFAFGAGPGAQAGGKIGGNLIRPPRGRANVLSGPVPQPGPHGPGYILARFLRFAQDRLSGPRTFRAGLGINAEGLGYQAPPMSQPKAYLVANSE